MKHSKVDVVGLAVVLVFTMVAVAGVCFLLMLSRDDLSTQSLSVNPVEKIVE